MRTCERSLGPAECFGLQEELLACYEAAPASGFVCSGQGFQQIARPEESVCPGERDALIECAYPEVSECLDLCRAIDAVYGAGAGSDAGAEVADAGSARPCPSYDIPCNPICWLVPLVLGGAIEPEAGAAGAAGAGPGRDARAVAEAAFVCAIERADACRAGEPVMGATWTSVLFDCAEELTP